MKSRDSATQPTPASVGRVVSFSRVGAVYGLMVLLPIAAALALLRFADGTRAAPGTMTTPAAAQDTVGLVLLAGVVIVACAGLLGTVCRAVGQSPVVGEMVAGILLGPSAFGALAPGLEARLFPPEVMGPLNVLAQVGVVFFMFLIGLEVPLTMLRRVGRAVLPLGHGAVAVPFALGIALALALRGTYQPPHMRDLPFVLFVALSVSVTAFPVLARILSDRNLVGTRIGTVGLTMAGVGDVTAWCVLGLVVAEVRNDSSLGLLRTVIELAAFTGLLWFAVRPGLAWLLREIERRWSTAALGMMIAAFVLLCAVLTNSFGVHPIFGAFLAGIVMPRSSRSVADFAAKTEGFTLWVLMPLFFATIGLQTHLLSVFTAASWLPLVGVLGVAIGGKFLGASGAALLAGEDRRSAVGLGIMMNCRGLTELVVLNIGLSLGAIGPDLFSLLVFMTIVTTMMTDPLLRLVKIGRPESEKSKPAVLVDVGSPS